MELFCEVIFSWWSKLRNCHGTTPVNDKPGNFPGFPPLYEKQYPGFLRIFDKMRSSNPSIIVLLLLAFPFFSPGQVQKGGRESPSSSDSINRYDDQGRRHGPWVKTFKGTDDIRYSGQFHHGRPAGTFVYYYRNGEVKARSEFSGNGKVAHTTTYYPNGKIMAKGRYVNQKKDSIWTFYDGDGVVSAKESYDKGAKDGKSISYYLNGQAAEVLHWKDSVKHGAWKKFFKDGTLKMEGQYKDGNPVGEFIHYHPNSKVRMRGKYKAAVKHGKWIHYKSDGSLKGIEHYNFGETVQYETAEEVKKKHRKEQEQDSLQKPSLNKEPKR